MCSAKVEKSQDSLKDVEDLMAKINVRMVELTQWFGTDTAIIEYIAGLIILQCIPYSCRFQAHLVNQSL